jgi:hypothetical protein
MTKPYLKFDVFYFVRKEGEIKQVFIITQQLTTGFGTTSHIYIYKTIHSFYFFYCKK